MSISNIYSNTEIARLSVPPQRAELFLERLANLQCANPRKLQVFLGTFSDLLPAQGPALDPEEPRIFGVNPDAFREAMGKPDYFLWIEAQPMLREVWKEPAALLKESGLMMLAATYMKACEPKAGLRPKGADRFLMVLLYALKHVHLLRYCANPGCKEPYFVARRGSQIYCGSPCAAPAQKEAKLKWWRERGIEWREKSRKRRGKHAKAT